MEHWHFLESGRGRPAWNMALDEALLEASAALGSPLLRFYGWETAASTFGYFQKYGEVACWTALRPLIRRPTGGGLVPHDQDWTYGFVAPPSHPWYELRAPESYRRLHLWIRDAFLRLGVPGELAAEPNRMALGQCFLGAEPNDLLVNGRKLAGAAQRRSRQGLLIQGSVQPPPRGIARARWEQTMLSVAAERWGVQWLALALPAPVIGRARELEESRYGRAAFNEKR